MSAVRKARLAAVATVAMLVAGLGLSTSGASATSVTFEYTGAPQQWTVPDSVGLILIQAFGAQGGTYVSNISGDETSGDPGGLGGQAIAPLATGDLDGPIQVNVGGQGGNYAPHSEQGGAGGFNGGGAGGSGPVYNGGTPYSSASAGGGGASDVRTGAFELADRAVIAGGGGGTGAITGFLLQRGCDGGAGGGTTGGDGTVGGDDLGDTCDEQGGRGGTASGGGAGGSPTPGSSHAGGAGSLGNGGSGGAGNLTEGLPNQAGGGGGGGLYGGGGGATDGGGGGGGSGLVPANGPGTMSAGVRSGNGQVTITYSSIESVEVNAAKVTLGPAASLNVTTTLDGYEPTGQVSFDLYGPGDPNCAAAPVFHDSETLQSSLTVQSSNFKPLATGTYRWIVSYSGDQNNQSLVGSCGGDGGSVQVVPAAPTGLGTSPASPSNSTTPKIAGNAADGSTVSLYTADDCSGTPVTTGSASDFASPGIPVSVSANSTSTFYATATAPDGGTSPCSAGVTFVNDSLAPTAQITSQPDALTNSTSATFAYTSSKSGSTFQCRLDTGDFLSCPSSGETYTGLAAGDHTFGVKATDPAGNDSPVQSYTWTIDLNLPVVTLQKKPPAITNSTAASFTYSSTISGTTFECALDGQALDSCPSTGIAYSGLDDGSHTFSVRGISPLGNTGPATLADWTIDTVDPTATILTTPPANSDSATATFTYSSSEPGSTFQCQLDSQPFTSCAGTGVSYPGLSNGSHAFGVRATDAAGNVSEAVAFSWTVDVPPPPATRAKLGRVSVSGPKRARKGRPATFKVKVTNSGNAVATGVKLRASGRGISAVASAGSVPAGGTKTIKLKLRPKKTGKVKVTFKVTTANAGTKTSGKKIAVRK